MSESAATPLVITEQNFEAEVINSDKPVLVDFWAEWCGPCRAVGPVIESLADQFDGQARIGKVDIDSNQQLAMKFGIRSIPTVMLFDKGKVAATFVGVRSRSEYEQSVSSALAKRG